MSLASRVLDAMGIGNGEDQSIEVQHNYASLLEQFNKVNRKYDQALATNEQDLRELSALRASKSALLGRIAVLQSELQACKDDLFRMQPTSQVPDSMIAQRFQSLDAQICDWIGTEISRFLDKWQPKHSGDQPKLFDHCGDPTTKGFLACYPDTGGEHMVRSIIHYYFQKQLLGDKILLFGLDDIPVGWLKWIEQSMSKLQPQRGE